MSAFLQILGLDRKEARSLQSGLFTMAISAFVTVVFYIMGLAVISHFNTVSDPVSHFGQSAKFESESL